MALRTRDGAVCAVGLSDGRCCDRLGRKKRKREAAAMRRFLLGLLSLCPLMTLPASAQEEPVGDNRGAAAAAAAAEAAKAPEADEVVVGAYVNDIHELDFRTTATRLISMCGSVGGTRRLSLEVVGIHEPLRPG